MRFSGRRLLFLGAHPDDIELGAGALIHRIAGSCELNCVTLSENRKTKDLSGLLDQHRRSLTSLGVLTQNIRLEGFETRRFFERRQDILDRFMGFRRELEPDLVFVHSPHDVHQDHNVMTNEALRAFRGTTVLGYEILRSSNGFMPQLLVEVSSEDVASKVAALTMYEVYRDKSYFNPDVIRASMLRNGELAELPFAEGFEILRGIARFE
ncbi:MAG TPA: PIG-L family deacetylase [bacterium]|nr:PIG-L family deacetylase [bacterium]